MKKILERKEEARTTDKMKKTKDRLLSMEKLVFNMFSP